MGDAGGAALPGTILHSMGEVLRALHAAPAAYDEGLMAMQGQLGSRSRLFMSGHLMDAVVETMPPFGAQGCA